MVAHKLLPCVLSVALLCGCGSSDDARGEAALARLRNMPKPGYLRFVNLSAEPLDVFAKQRRLNGSIPVEGYAQLTPIGAGMQKLKVGGADLQLDVPAAKSATTVVYPTGKTETLWGDERAPGEQGNVRIVFAKGDGSASLPGAGISIKGPKSATITKETVHLSLDVGDYTVAGSPVKIEERCAYTFLFVPRKGSLKPFLMKNTMNEKPLSAGSGSS